MPLLKGKSNIGRNITELRNNGSRPRSEKQILAIALHVAGVPKKKASGGLSGMGLGKAK